MKLRFLALLLVFAALPVAMQAQSGGGLYLNPVAIRISNSTPDNGLFAFLGPGSTSRMFYGVSMGFYQDFKVQPKLGVGFDIRENIVHGNNAALESLLFGVRVVDRPFSVPLKLYAEPALGLGRSRAPYEPVHQSNLETHIFVGADYPLQKYVDWRVVEVGYGSVNTISSADYGYNVSSLPASNLLSITTGLIFRIP